MGAEHRPRYDIMKISHLLLLAALCCGVAAPQAAAAPKRGKAKPAKVVRKAEPALLTYARQLTGVLKGIKDADSALESLPELEGILTAAREAESKLTEEQSYEWKESDAGIKATNDLYEEGLRIGEAGIMEQQPALFAQLALTKSPYQGYFLNEDTSGNISKLMEEGKTAERPEAVRESAFAAAAAKRKAYAAAHCETIGAELGSSPETAVCLHRFMRTGKNFVGDVSVEEEAYNYLTAVYPDLYAFVAPVEEDSAERILKTQLFCGTVAGDDGVLRIGTITVYFRIRQ